MVLGFLCKNSIGTVPDRKGSKVQRVSSVPLKVVSSKNKWAESGVIRRVWASYRGAGYYLLF
jgi:hypothetical protein